MLWLRTAWQKVGSVIRNPHFAGRQNQEGDDCQVTDEDVSTAMRRAHMSLLEVYEGRMSWAEYLSQQTGMGDDYPLMAEASEGEATLRLSLSELEYQTALTAGLGALGNRGRDAGQISPHLLEFNLATLADGVAQLNADFTPLLGDLVWKLEMQHSATLDLLQEIRLAEFEREARAYRARAERAYLNGWYEEALADFLKAEKRNYPDYVVLRCIANIYLYHVINLPKALAYFGKVAKYARPCDARQAAEACYFAGLICLIEQRPEEALAQLQEAVALHPQFYEAHYQRAAVAAWLGQAEEAISSLEQAISGDARYYERVKNDALFEALRAQVQSLLERLVQPVEEGVERVKKDAAQLQGYVIAEAEQAKLSSLFQQLKEQQTATFRERLQMLERLTEFRQELEHIHERFDKHYAIDPRDYVRSIAFSHSGQWLAAGFLHGGVQFWEVDSMLQRNVFIGHYASVNSVAFSPNDLLLVTGSRDRAIKLWDADSGREIQVLNGHTAEVSAVTFSPDGQWLVSGSHDKTIRIWRAATGHEVETLRGHTRPVTSVVFSPDGQRLASGGWDRTIRLWELDSGRATGVLTGHRKGVASLAMSPDGRRLASGGESGEVKLWDLQTGREARSFAGLQNSVTSVAFSPDGALLAAGSLGVRIMVWKTATAEVVRQLQYENISYNSAAFSPSGQWLALGSRDLQLWLKVILTEEEYAAVKVGEERAVQADRAREEKLWPGYVPLLKE
jgi:WD40 repeat protein